MGGEKTTGTHLRDVGAIGASACVGDTDDVE